jgi:hypothetical protein
MARQFGIGTAYTLYLLYHTYPKFRDYAVNKDASPQEVQAFLESGNGEQVFQQAVSESAGSRSFCLVI